MKDGDTFEIDERDFKAARPGSMIEISVPESTTQEIVTPEPPKPLTGGWDDWKWTDIKGIGPSKAKALSELGIHAPNDFNNADEQTLKDILKSSYEIVLEAVENALE